MEIYTMMTVSALLPTAAWPLSASMPAAAPSALLAAERTLSELVRALPTAAALVPAPREHQVPTQAELGKATQVRVNGFNGTTGFKGSNSTISSKRYTDGGSGVPPRGRPV
ncbi:hypothetical protein [Actinoplanes utahensis]|uniref:Uncharacterized protein n=1 Tax=Actinoplanes utahensis TaxID=1869 RepID=A0A0A6U9S3_ACTUT|nr:hypothetical protein [Actinoplanes utahensis]KHD72775.1 hypothetical protein MB27_41025 [Actinoplanes utahensis]GIF29035.1 hypothetical protein Aut01nite_20210 [Actinoplanes utahensis]